MFSPLKVELATSLCLKWILITCHLFTVICLMTSDFELVTRLILSLLTVVHFLVLYLFPYNQGVKTIIWNADIPLFITLDDSKRSSSHPQPVGMLVLPFILCIKIIAVAPVANQWLVLLPDMMSKDQWRKLKVLARLSELKN